MQIIAQIEFKMTKMEILERFFYKILLKSTEQLKMSYL